MLYLKTNYFVLAYSIPLLEKASPLLFQAFHVLGYLWLLVIEVAQIISKQLLIFIIISFGKPRNNDLSFWKALVTIMYWDVAFDYVKDVADTISDWTIEQIIIIWVFYIQIL